MDFNQFKDMIQRIKVLENALGTGEKIVYASELKTRVLQRRCVHTSKDILAGATLSESDLEILRPAPENSVLPKHYGFAIGKKLNRDLKKGDPLRYKDFFKCLNLN